MATVALRLKSGLPLAQVVRIQLSVLDPAGSTSPTLDEEATTMPPTLPAAFAHASSVLERVSQLQSSELPFVAWIVGSGLIHVACAKVVVAKVFKLLHSKQRELGVKVTDVKTNILLQPMSQQELAQVCSRAVAAALEQRGWAALASNALLGDSLLGAADGMAHTLEHITLHVQPLQPDGMLLLLRAEVVRFQHPAVRRDGAEANLAQLGKKLEGSICTVLPHYRQAIMCGIRTADATTLAQLRLLWASYGVTLPEAVPYLVVVRFDYDEDAPSFPYPPCCLLGQAGLDPIHSRLDSGPVQAVLARVRDDLAKSSFGFWGGSSLKLLEAKVWYPDGAPAQRDARQQLQMPALVFQTARQLAQPSVQQQAVEGPALGPAVDIDSFSCSDSSGSSSGGTTVVAGREKKPQTLPGPALSKFIHKMEEEAHKAEAANAAAKPAASPVPKPAASRIPAAAGGPQIAPKFKSSAAPKAPARAPAQKRPAPAGTAQRVPKAVKAAACTMAAGAAQTAAAAAVAGAATLAQPSAADAVGGAAAKPAKPKAPPLEVEAVVAKVQQQFAAGKLSVLTIPEMKCYLKSIKKPVGGKKADLEERVRQHLEVEA